MLTDLYEWLRGKKTYIFAIAMILVAGLYQQGYITDTQFKTLETLLGGGTVIALRAGISKGANKS